MHLATADSLNAEQIAAELRAFVDRAVAANGGSTVARRPAHRVKFHWPPHPISYSFHVLASDWKGRAAFEAHGETFEVEVANTPYGVFGRCQDIWHEERGETLDEMLKNLRASSVPLFSRQLIISRTLEQFGRFKDHVRDLTPLDHLKLLYCEDRDVANEAKTEIETHASTGLYFPGLISILDDRRHPDRRSAQWCVLDLFESLPDFCETEEQELEAVRAMRDLIWTAEDDYARTIYKAGVVLGGHIPYRYGGPTLLECLSAPSKIGRRSAIHGLFHVVEWIPEMRDLVVAALERQAEVDEEPELREFAASMAHDIADAALEHRIEPVFPEENS
ncbi:MAG TPA: hypothetical protein VK934_07975 [Fimbriimonas sp.]|nr:hypothetical protein [Fimbriimonas sp.]